MKKYVFIVFGVRCEIICQLYSLTHFSKKWFFLRCLFQHNVAYLCPRHPSQHRIRRNPSSIYDKDRGRERSIQNNPNAEIKITQTSAPQRANIITDTKIIIGFITGAAVNAVEASLEFYAPVSQNPTRRTKTKLYQEMLQTALGGQSDEDPIYLDAHQARMMNTPSDEWE